MAYGEEGRMGKKHIPESVANAEPLGHAMQKRPGKAGYEVAEHHREGLKGWPHMGGDGLRRTAEPGYETSAHSMEHHGSEGEAVGKHGDTFVPAAAEIQGEGRVRLAQPSWAEEFKHGTQAKAHHHPPAGGETHMFPRTPAGESHGYGHSQNQRAGHFRLSGHSGAHRIGKGK